MKGNRPTKPPMEGVGEMGFAPIISLRIAEKANFVAPKAPVKKFSEILMIPPNIPNHVRHCIGISPELGCLYNGLAPNIFAHTSD